MKVKTHLVRAGGREYQIEVISREREMHDHPGRLRVRLDGDEIEVRYQLAAPGLVQLWYPDRSESVRLEPTPDGMLASAGGCHLFVERCYKRASSTGKSIPPEVTPPIPAVVIQVLVDLGDRVLQGQALLVVSAMKMETKLLAPRSGVVTAVRARVGDKVRPGQVLVVIEDTGSEEKTDVDS